MTNGDKGGRGLLVGGDVTMHLLVFKMMEMETKPELTTIKLSTFILISVRSNSKSTSLAQGLYRHYMSHKHYMSQQHYMSQSTLYVARSTLYVAINTICHTLNTICRNQHYMLQSTLYVARSTLYVVSTLYVAKLTLYVAQRLNTICRTSRHYISH